MTENKEVYTRGREIYEKLLPGLQNYTGQFIAIEPQSREYFIAPTITKALKKARAKFPDKLFFTAKISEEEGVVARKR